MTNPSNNSLAPSTVQRATAVVEESPAGGSRCPHRRPQYERHRPRVYCRRSGERLLDLYCGAGVGADGYAAAGFEVTGVDQTAQPDYPYEFIQANALDVLGSELPEGFDFIHASPPCQAFTQARHLRAAQGGKAVGSNVLRDTIALLRSRWSHKTWIVENVPGAPCMDGAIQLCGSAFQLGVRRHRLFVSNRRLRGTHCNHHQQGRPWGVYHVPGDSIPHGGRTARNVTHGREVMGVERRIPWSGLKEGIPPAYTHWLGRQLITREIQR